jgi:hypothetical protein
MQFELIRSSHTGHFSVYRPPPELGDCPIFAFEQSGRTTRPPTSFPSCAEAANLVLEELAARGKVISFAGDLLFKVPGGGWEPATNAYRLLSLLEPHAHFTTHRAAAAWNGKLPASLAEASLGRVLANFPASGEITKFHRFPGPTKTFGEQLLNTFSTAIPTATAFLNAPVFGERHRPNVVCVQRTPFEGGEFDAGYSHVKTLFANLELDAASHAALYCTLFGMLHVCSLDSEVPVLLVDSHRRGRGKSEVAKAFQVLLDGKPTTVSGNADNDAITAYLVRGGRVLTMQNFTGRAYSNPILSNLATDGQVHLRPKYARETVGFQGVLPVLTFVYGVASFDHDLIDRCFRVELSGEARPLSHKSHEYARKHRKEIITEIMAAHAHAALARPLRESYKKATRIDEFERTAAFVYAQVFGESPESALHLMVAGRKALLPEGPVLLHDAHREAFEAPDPQVVRPFTVRPDPQKYVGARALGFQLASDGKWHEICKE